jgi:hypothetical protein
MEFSGENPRPKIKAKPLVFDVQRFNTWEKNRQGKGITQAKPITFQEIKGLGFTLKQPDDHNDQSYCHP